MTPPSLRLAGRSRAAVWHPCTQMKQPRDRRFAADRRSPAARARGCMTSRAGAIWTRSARGGSICSATANPRINAALKDQLDRLEHVILAGFTHAPVVELSERLSALTGGVLGHCFYASDGSSAVEIALKMSFTIGATAAGRRKTSFSAWRAVTMARPWGRWASAMWHSYKEAYAPLMRQA